MESVWRQWFVGVFCNYFFKRIKKAELWGRTNSQRRSRTIISRCSCWGISNSSQMTDAEMWQDQTLLRCDGKGGTMRDHTEPSPERFWEAELHWLTSLRCFSLPLGGSSSPTAAAAVHVSCLKITWAWSWHDVLHVHTHAHAWSPPETFAGGPQLLQTQPAGRISSFNRWCNKQPTIWEDPDAAGGEQVSWHWWNAVMSLLYSRWRQHAFFMFEPELWAHIFCKNFTILLIIDIFFKMINRKHWKLCGHSCLTVGILSPECFVF